MKLTSYSNYTLRILMVAASRFPKLTTIREVAGAFGIAQTHLVKCVHRLGQWGYIKTVRGAGGGFRLARDAGSISVGEIIRRTEEGFDVVECFDAETNSCPLVGQCRLRPAFLRAVDAFLRALDEVTIEDIADNGDDLLELLRLRPAPAPQCRENRVSA